MMQFRMCAASARMCEVLYRDASAHMYIHLHRNLDAGILTYARS